MKWTITNIITSTRILAVPFLLYLAWSNEKTGFLILLLFSLATDAVDGFLARKLNQESEWGAKLDSWGDFGLMAITPLCVWWLWPELTRRESVFILLFLAAFFLPISIGFVKFRRLTSYHTWLAKTSAILLGLGVGILLVWHYALIFRVGICVFMVSALEEIAITLVSTAWQSNVPTLRHALKNRGRNPDFFK
ncbi:MAG: CDP-alcohol phosphatidyltransferase family protein [Desulfobacteraceae bacterium]|nr:MAG: CDP-alcohol phosphatidyltransferase family protein [Desulfobacteraceae bacterium]